MITYSIYFTKKADVDEAELLAKAKAFADLLAEQRQIHHYEFIRITNKANFTEMPAFRLEIYFDSQAQMDVCFGLVKQRHMQSPPHSSLMNSVSEFKVTFGEVL